MFIHITARQAKTPEGWHGAAFPVSGFPVPAAELALLGPLVARLLFEALAQPGLHPLVIAQTASLHRNNTWQRFAANGSRWLPAPSFGVWPEDPPRLMQASDFDNLQFGKPVRSMLDPLLILTLKNPADMRAVFEELLGCGAAMFLVSKANQAATLEASRALLDLIKDVTFRSLPAYLPLFREKNLGYLAAETAVRQSVEPLEIYFRENPEEGSMLLLSRAPLETALAATGGVWNPQQRIWQFDRG